MKRIATFTSGGDAQGMNSTVRSVVRTGLDRDVMELIVGHNGLLRLLPLG
ncbi:MAG: 6-phosphofructokinase, partial [Anaerolineae bacterium]|nr:6-phosphofructokinase [Anaerolineae bacterium]